MHAVEGLDSLAAECDLSGVMLYPEPQGSSFRQLHGRRVLTLVVLLLTSQVVQNFGAVTQLSSKTLGSLCDVTAFL